MRLKLPFQPHSGTAANLVHNRTSTSQNSSDRVISNRGGRSLSDSRLETSFGFSAGDFLVVGQLCWKVYKKCKDSPGNYAELSGEVSTLYAVMKETEELLSQQNLSADQEAKLRPCQQGCDKVLKDFNSLLVKYESLGTKSQRTFDRMGFGNQDIHGIRLRLLSNVTMLDAFNNAYVSLQSKPFWLSAD